MKPACVTWNGVAFAPNPRCKVIAYTAYNTTCSCSSSVVRSSDHRRLASSSSGSGSSSSGGSSSGGTGSSSGDGSSPGGGSSGSVNGDTELQEYATFGEVFGENFVDPWKSAGELNLSTVRRNLTILITVAVVLGLFLCGLAGLLRWDREEKATAAEKPSEYEEDAILVLPFEKFLARIMPFELKDRVWYVRLWVKLQEEHSWIAIVSAEAREGDFRFLRFIEAMGTVIIAMFLDTLFARQTFSDNSYCANYFTEHECLSIAGASQLLFPFIRASAQDTQCTWDNVQLQCSYNANTSNYDSIALTIIVTIVAIPFTALLVFFLYHLRLYMVVTNNFFGLEVSGKHENVETVPELATWQTHAGTLLRGAKLAKMQATIDSVSLDVEVDDMKRLIESKETFALKNPKERHLPKYQNALSHVVRQDISVVKLMKRVEKARSVAEDIEKKLGLFETDDERDAYLMQQFVITGLALHRQSVAKRFFEDPMEKDEKAEPEKRLTDSSIKLKPGNKIKKKKKSNVGIVTWISIILLPIYVSGLCLYIFLTGVLIGEQQVNVWVKVSIISILYDAVLLQPMKIGMMHVLLPQAVNFEMQSFFKHMKARAKQIMLRQTRILHQCSRSLIQHLNPACRAARKWPQLTVSRLLISLTDGDLPRYFSFKEKHELMALIPRTILTVVIMLFAYMEEDLQDFTLSTLVTTAINAVLAAVTFSFRCEPFAVYLFI